MPAFQKAIERELHHLALHERALGVAPGGEA
jgi:hypothetical protein